jgi:hypothetical protein
VFRTHLVDKSAPGTIAVFHYSGHGSRMTDLSGDEREDGLDETIVPQDSRQGGVVDITDDEVNALLTELTAKTKNVTVILDSCHSGTAAKLVAGGGSLVRQIPDMILPKPWPGGAAGGEERPGTRQRRVVRPPRGRPRSFRTSSSWTANPGAVLPDGGLGGLREMTYRELYDLAAPQVTAAFPISIPRSRAAPTPCCSGADDHLGRSLSCIAAGQQIAVDGGLILASAGSPYIYEPTVRVSGSQQADRALGADCGRRLLIRGESARGPPARRPDHGAPALREPAPVCSASTSACGAGHPRRCGRTSAALDEVREAAVKTGLVELSPANPGADDRRGAGRAIRFLTAISRGQRAGPADAGMANTAANKLSAVEVVR